MQQQPKRKIRKRTWIIIVIAALLVIGIGNAIASGGKGVGNTSSTPTAQDHATSVPTHAGQPTQAPTQKPKPSFATFGDGTYTIGKDIQPGTYRTRSGSSNCYYARLSGFGGTVGEILANENTDNPAIVTIGASDKGFTSSSCGTWTADLSRITSSQTSFGAGMYIVGVDIQPGTYKSSGQANCYYARLSGFSGSLDEIISNDNTDSAAIVTIAAGDKGFVSSSCGTWTKQ